MLAVADKEPLNILACVINKMRFYTPESALSTLVDKEVLFWSCVDSKCVDKNWPQGHYFAAQVHYHVLWIYIIIDTGRLVILRQHFKENITVL